jgi:glycosyltransferase involved in cell wall biosynthesis
MVGSKYGEDLKSFYKFSNYFLQLSSYEGMPHSILEAMNYELKIIASNFGGNYELLGDSDFGFTSPSLDIETVTNTIYKAIKDNSDITTKSKELVNKHYNIENTINKFSEIILENE